MPRVKNILKQFLPIGLVIFACCGLTYLAVQQVLRMGANDPQIQMAEDAAVALGGGAEVASIVPAGQVDLSASLAPFMLVYDDAGKLLASSAQLHGQPPELPPGVLDYVRQHGEDRVTWQPETGVRIAAVVERFTGSSSGFVLAGRSLREVEKREDQALQETGLVLGAALLGALAVILFGEFVLTPRRQD